MTLGCLALTGRAPRLHREGSGFDSPDIHYGRLGLSAPCGKSGGAKSQRLAQSCGRRPSPTCRWSHDYEPQRIDMQAATNGTCGTSCTAEGRHGSIYLRSARTSERFVRASSPVRSLYRGYARASGTTVLLHGERSDVWSIGLADVAQTVEQRTRNAQVHGSTPCVGFCGDRQ